MLRESELSAAFLKDSCTVRSAVVRLRWLQVQSDQVTHQSLLAAYSRLPLPYGSTLHMHHSVV